MFTTELVLSSHGSSELGMFLYAGQVVCRVNHVSSSRYSYQTAIVTEGDMWIQTCAWRTCCIQCQFVDFIKLLNYSFTDFASY